MHVFGGVLSVHVGMQRCDRIGVAWYSTCGAPGSLVGTCSHCVGASLHVRSRKDDQLHGCTDYAYGGPARRGGCAVGPGPAPPDPCRDSLAPRRFAAQLLPWHAECRPQSGSGVVLVSATADLRGCV